MPKKVPAIGVAGAVVKGLLGFSSDIREHAQFYVTCTVLCNLSSAQSYNIPPEKFC